MELTREQVIKALKCCSNQVCQCKNCPIYRINNGNCTQGDVDALMFSAAELLEQDIRTPDAVTGLVNCGCGGKAQIINSSGYSRRLYVECDRRAMMLGVEATGDGALQGIYRYDDQIIKDWNHAMGILEVKG